MSWIKKFSNYSYGKSRVSERNVAMAVSDEAR